MITFTRIHGRPTQLLRPDETPMVRSIHELGSEARDSVKQTKKSTPLDQQSQELPPHNRSRDFHQVEFMGPSGGTDVCGDLYWTPE